MRIALVKNHLVENIIIAESLEFCFKSYPTYSFICVDSLYCKIGMTYLNGEFSEEANDDEIEEET